MVRAFWLFSRVASTDCAPVPGATRRLRKLDGPRPGDFMGKLSQAIDGAERRAASPRT